MERRGWGEGWGMERREDWVVGKEWWEEGWRKGGGNWRVDEGGTEGGGGRVVEGEVYLPPTFFSLETNYPPGNH